MNIKNSLDIYFSKLEKLYRKEFGTLPSISWDESLNKSLFVSEPDEDGEVQWKPKVADHITVSGLCDELSSFYSSYYYWELRGKYKNDLYIDFPPIWSKQEAYHIIQTSIDDGNYYFKGQNTVLLAYCSQYGNDDLLMFYRQDTGEIFLYDTDKRFIYPLNVSLAELISSMEALI